MLTPQQIHTLSELLERQLVFFAGSTLGADILSDSERELLKSHGINPDTIYVPSQDLVLNNFVLGMLSDILGAKRTENMTFDQLTKYVASGQYIPLNAREKATINSLKMQSLADIRSAHGRIFRDVNNVVASQLGSARADQQEFIRERVVDGIAKRQSFNTIARELNRLTGDWSRNFHKSVQYIAHTALNEGRAAMIERRHGGNHAKMYFHVQPDACDKCVDKYLTNGRGSEPRLFTLQQLQANGNNIGRKASEWLATLSALHVNCRCLADEYIEGQVWNGTKYVWPEGVREPRVQRPKIKITFNGQEYLV